MPPAKTAVRLARRCTPISSSASRASTLACSARSCRAGSPTRSRRRTPSSAATFPTVAWPRANGAGLSHPRRARPTVAGRFAACSRRLSSARSGAFTMRNFVCTSPPTSRAQSSATRPTTPSRPHPMAKSTSIRWRCGGRPWCGRPCSRAACCRRGWRRTRSPTTSARR